MRTLSATAATLAITVAITGCGGDEPAPSATTSATSPAPAPRPGPPSPEPATPVPQQGDGNDAGPPPSGGGAPARDPDPFPRDDEAAKRGALRAAQDAYRAYIAAINDRDGERLCALLPPGAERPLRPAVAEGDCADRIGASIGYEDPRGYPVWKATALSGIESASIGRDLDSARLTGAIVTSFADRTEPSIESDIAYLERAGDRWRLAKPTGALYRAIGQPEIPPSVISPP